MSNRDRNRAEREREREEFEARQAAREAGCMHWYCVPERCDWQGRITHVKCTDCNGINEIEYDT